MIDTLLIGGRGSIGAGLRTYLQKLAPHYQITSIDLPGAEDKATDPAAQCLFVDLDIAENPKFFGQLLEGRDLVVFLARTTPHEAMMALTDLVYESVRRFCPKALIIGSSSVHAVDAAYWPFDREPYTTIAARRFDELDAWPEPLSALMEACPTSEYGKEKAYAEEWTLRLADEGMSVVAARWGGINWRNTNSEEIGYFTVWCHQEDASQFVDCCLRAHRDNSLRSGAHYFVISNNKHHIFDIETPNREIGYNPIHNAEVFY